jgi:uncharacterized protein (DUF1778 family)
MLAIKSSNGVLPHRLFFDMLRSLAQTNMTDFILRTVLREAQAVIEEHERVKLTRRDSHRVLELLENPPPPNGKLRKAARTMPAPS